MQVRIRSDLIRCCCTFHNADNVIVVFFSHTVPDVTKTLHLSLVWPCEKYMANQLRIDVMGQGQKSSSHFLMVSPAGLGLV